MVFQLRGGPRDGQLVDDLPSSYVVNGQSEGGVPPLFDDVVPVLADWRAQPPAAL